MSSSKEKGTICGTSAKEKKRPSCSQSLPRFAFTIDFQLCRIASHPGRVPGRASVLPTMPVPQRVYAEYARPGPDLGSGQPGLGGDHVSLEGPADLDGRVSLLHYAGDLGVQPLVQHIGAEGKGRDGRGHCTKVVLVKGGEMVQYVNPILHPKREGVKVPTRNS